MLIDTPGRSEVLLAMGDSAKPKTSPGIRGEERSGTIDYATYIADGGYSDFRAIAEEVISKMTESLNA